MNLQPKDGSIDVRMHIDADNVKEMRHIQAEYFAKQQEIKDMEFIANELLRSAIAARRIEKRTNELITRAKTNAKEPHRDYHL